MRFVSLSFFMKETIKFFFPFRSLKYVVEMSYLDFLRCRY